MLPGSLCLLVIRQKLPALPSGGSQAMGGNCYVIDFNEEMYSKVAENEGEMFGTALAI